MPNLDGALASGGNAATSAKPPEGRWLDVTVVDVDTDKPVADAGVWAVRESEHYRARTSATGTARLGPYARGEIELGVRADGWLMAEPIPRVPDGTADAQVRIRLRRGLAIAGMVLAPGDVPAAGAWVVARQGTKEAITDTDAAGSFRFPALDSGAWAVRVQKHFGGPVVQSVEVLAGTDDLVIRLRDALPQELLVHVFAPDGTPIPAFDYAWAAAGGFGTGDWSDPPMRLPPGMAVRWLEITKPRDASGKPLPYAPASIGPIQPGETTLVIHLADEDGIGGHVVDADGAPVPDVRLRAWPLDRGPATGYVAGFHDDVRSDAAGTFQLSRLATTTYRLQFDAGDAFVPTRPLTVEAGTKDLVVRLQRGLRVELLVVDPAGEPVPGAHVLVNRYGDFAAGHADETGHFAVLGVAKDGRYPVRVRPPSSRPDLALLTVVAWSPSDLRLELPAAMPTRGRVVDGDGKPVAGAHVNGIGGDDATYGTTTSPKGEFVLPHVAHGLVRLRANRDDLLSPVTDFPSGGHDIELLVRPGANLDVVFKGWPEGLGDVQAVMQLPSFGYAASVSVVQSDGRVAFGRLDPDATYALFVVVGEGKEQRVAWAPGLRAGSEPVQIALRPAQSLTGTVTIPRDAQLPTIRVRQDGVEAKTVADSSGRFTLTGLPEGTWTVTATASGGDGTYTGETVGRTGTSVRIELSR